MLPLTLIVAPAGWGKSTLVADWLARDRVAAGWVSLDGGDDDPKRFWRYLLLAAGEPAAGARPVDRGTGRAAAVQHGRGQGVLRRPARSGAARAGRAPAPDPHRGMGRRVATGGAAAKGPNRPIRLHRAVHRRGLAYRQLSLR